jgi:hypothetical protein
MPKCVLRGKGHDTHGQSELVRYHMLRTAAHGRAGPGAARRMGTAGASSVREHGPACAAEHGDGGMHARTVREVDGRAVLLAAAALTPGSNAQLLCGLAALGSAALHCVATCGRGDRTRTARRRTLRSSRSSRRTLRSSRSSASTPAGRAPKIEWWVQTTDRRRMSIFRSTSSGRSGDTVLMGGILSSSPRTRLPDDRYTVFLIDIPSS